MICITNPILFGKYQLISALGSGSFGTVYLSKHLTLESYRAIKRIPKQSGVPTSLLSEAQLLKSLNHPGIPQIYDLEEDNDYFYMIEEYVEGESLNEFLLHQSNISLEFFLNICLQLCDIFQYLHTLTPSPVLYLDLKPEHIIVCGTHIKLIDFNVATYPSNSGNIYYLFGNLDYSAPELQASAPPNPLCDIYSIGQIMNYLSDHVDIPLPPNIHKIIHKAAHADAFCRFETVDKLASALLEQQKLLNQPHLCKTIAVVGSHPGCGSTHIALSLVSALNYMGYTTCYLEKNEQNNLLAILNSESRVIETKGRICYRFFMGYPNYGPGIVLPDLSDYLHVVDYGCDFSTVSDDTDLILYVCDYSLWHRQTVIDKGDTLISMGKPLKILCNRGQRDSLQFLVKRFQQPIYLYPHWSNPFVLHKRIVSFFSQLLNIKRRNPLFSHLKRLFLTKK